MYKYSFLTFLATAVLSTSAQAALVVSGGNWELQPNLAGQQISVGISGTGSVTNATVILQITGSGSLPVFTAAGITTGTIFATNNNGSPQYDLSSPQLAYADVATLTDTVDGNGTLAVFTVDTTGISSGAYGLKLTGTTWGDSVVGTLPTTDVSFLDGSITIAIPEPSGLAALALVGFGLVRRTRR